MEQLLRDFRRVLHQHPELSGEEKQTAQRVKAFLLAHSQPKIIEGIGGHGLAAVYQMEKEGPTVLVRCELDALPITEANTFSHRSQHDGVSHKCGHDGHMAILCGLAIALTQNPLTCGKVVLLFQPAEENGQGAHAVLQDPKFNDIAPDFCLALHNLPGYALGSVLVKEAGFTASVVSLALHLEGKIAHASEPHHGINPAEAISDIITFFKHKEVADPSQAAFALATPIHINLGQLAYGVAAGKAKVHYTLRTWSDANLQALKQEFESYVTQLAAKKALQFQLNWLEYFPGVQNNTQLVHKLQSTCQEQGISIKTLEHALRFGEDFGWFSKKFPSLLFGLGSGENCPALHHSDYDFPDELIEKGIQLFYGLLVRLCS
ncbi:amidohydrolase [Sediminicola luteus]|uniref:Peptidase M20 dimerisation domain-containing protein n=1 Tax=Sediminicola luteus TaxID=319238 RepID=A0A2A4G1K2_9FLAO|nr:amidohydrolase [Sediminicola luteus]PCE62567.1 hypothetical protein B7P33_18190 [Sediminicola luteus]